MGNPGRGRVQQCCRCCPPWSRNVCVSRGIATHFGPIFGQDMLIEALQKTTTQPQWERTMANDSCPRQDDGINCGVYALGAISMFLRGNDPLLAFSAKRPNCTRWRQQLLWSSFTGTVHLDLTTGTNVGDLPCVLHGITSCTWPGAPCVWLGTTFRCFALGSLFFCMELHYGAFFCTMFRVDPQLRGSSVPSL